MHRAEDTDALALKSGELDDRYQAFAGWTGVSSPIMTTRVNVWNLSGERAVARCHAPRVVLGLLSHRDRAAQRDDALRTPAPFVCRSGTSRCARPPPQPSPRSPCLHASPCAAHSPAATGACPPGELCDPTVHWADRCPAPVGPLLLDRAPNCNGRALSFGDEFVGLANVLFCTERTPGSRAEHRYDVTATSSRTSTPDHRAWTFAYDAQGHMTEQHMRVDPPRRQHLVSRVDRRPHRPARGSTTTPTRNARPHAGFPEHTPERRLDRRVEEPADGRGSAPGQRPAQQLRPRGPGSSSTRRRRRRGVAQHRTPSPTTPAR